MMSVASIFSVASSILIVAVVYILGANVEFIVRQLEGTMGIVVVVNEELGHTAIERLQERIRDLPHVSRVRHVTRAESLETMRDWIGNDAILEGLEQRNPLRDTLVVELTDLAQQEGVARSIENLQPYGVAHIRRDTEIAGILTTLSSLVQVVSAILVLVLGIISIIIITNTIRITVNARQTEINIMKYVGATDWFIRWPFVIEGMLIGLIGGAIPAGIAWLGYNYVVDAITRVPMLGFIVFMPRDDVFMYVLPFALILGTVIGLLGSSWSVKKHLKV